MPKRTRRVASKKTVRTPTAKRSVFAPTTYDAQIVVRVSSETLARIDALTTNERVFPHVAGRRTDALRLALLTGLADLEGRAKPVRG